MRGSDTFTGSRSLGCMSIENVLPMVPYKITKSATSCSAIWSF